VARKALAQCELDILRAILQKQKVAVYDPVTLQMLLANNNISIPAKTIIAQLESITIEPSFTQPSSAYASRNLALHQAARVGDLSTVKKLISSGANVNEKDLFKSTPLHMAAMYGHKPVAEYLIQQGAEINAKTYKIDNYALTPVDLAGQYAPNTETFSYLLSKGAEPEHWDILMFSLLEKVVNSYEKNDFKIFDLCLNKVEVAAKNKNALWVYTDNEVKPIWLLYKVFAADIADEQFYNRIIQTMNILNVNDINSLVKHYVSAKNLLHAFPSNEVYTYKIGPNKVKLSASGYYSIITVDLAVNTLNAFQKKWLGNQDIAGYQAMKQQFPNGDKSLLQNVEQFTNEKLRVFAHVENAFKQAAITISKAALYETSQVQFKRYEQGETILLPSGWDGHALDIIIDKSLNLFMVANAGERFEGFQPGLNAFNMQFALTSEDVHLLLTNEEEEALEFKKYYDLGLEKNEMFSFFFPPQVYGNCAWYSQQIAQKALITIELTKLTNDSTRAAAISDNWFKEYNEFHQTSVLKTYLEDPFLEVAALGDILMNYHKELTSQPENERAKLLLDHLTDSAHKNDFVAYCQSLEREVTSTLKKFIVENEYHSLDFLLHKPQTGEMSAEVLSAQDVITWDNEEYHTKTVTLGLPIPLVLPVLTLQEEQALFVL